MKFAYADPPYLGYGHKKNAMYHYGDRHPGAWVYDTVEGQTALVAQLVKEYPDGWALSLSSSSLKDILPACPRDCRIAAWVKPFASYKPNVDPAYAWEPVIFRGGRKRKDRPKGQPTTRDYCSANITIRKKFAGAKPQAFSWWIFDLLGVQAHDEVEDLFPGSGAVTRALAEYKRRLAFTVPEEVQGELFEKEVDGEQTDG